MGRFAGLQGQVFMNRPKESGFRHGRHTLGQDSTVKRHIPGYPHLGLARFYRRLLVFQDKTGPRTVAIECSIAVRGISSHIITGLLHQPFQRSSKCTVGLEFGFYRKIIQRRPGLRTITEADGKDARIAIFQQLRGEGCRSKIDGYRIRLRHERHPVGCHETNDTARNRSEVIYQIGFYLIGGQFLQSGHALVERICFHRKGNRIGHLRSFFRQIDPAFLDFALTGVEDISSYDSRLRTDKRINHEGPHHPKPLGRVLLELFAITCPHTIGRIRTNIIEGIRFQILGNCHKFADTASAYRSIATLDNRIPACSPAYTITLYRYSSGIQHLGLEDDTRSQLFHRMLFINQRHDFWNDGIAHIGIKHRIFHTSERKDSQKHGPYLALGIVIFHLVFLFYSIHFPFPRLKRIHRRSHSNRRI